MFFDIAVNPTKNVDEIVKRAKNANVMPIFVGVDEESSNLCIELAIKYNTFCYVGIHPNHIGNIKNINFNNENVIAIGECGLDYFRNNNYELQKKVFIEHLKYDKEYFFHCREAFDDFYNIISNRKLRGVVHSFDGTLEQANKLIEKGLFIGINGVSMREKEGCDVVKGIPLEYIILETDSPYCGIRKSYYASNYVTPIKGKNEPSLIIKNAEAISAIKGITLQEVEEAIYNNTLRLFPRLKEKLKYWEK